MVGGRPLTGSLGGLPPLEKLGAQEERACTYSPVILILKNRSFEKYCVKRSNDIEKKLIGKLVKKCSIDVLPFLSESPIICTLINFLACVRAISLRCNCCVSCFRPQTV